MEPMTRLRGGMKMRINGMAGLWARTALIWFLITISFGLYMGMTEQFQFGPAHAHIGLLGWLSSAAFAAFYAMAGEGATGAKGPRLQWGVHNVGVAVMTGSLFMQLKAPDTGWAPIIGLGAMIVIVGVVSLTLMLWPRLGVNREG
jgi:hypothetical protein